MSINQPGTQLIPLSTRFSLSPYSTGPTFTYSVGGVTFPYTTQADAVVRPSDVRYTSYKTPMNTPITFTALVTSDPNYPVVEYKWDFGDGAIGYGASITHTFTTPIDTQQINLKITDARGRQATANKVLHIYPASVATIGIPLIVVPS